MSDELAGLVDRVTYHDQQSGYTVAKLFVEGQEELVTVVGHFNQLAAGEALRLEGRWTQHPTHGAQFKVAHYRVERPATLVGMEKYLGSGMIKGVGPKTAAKLVKAFGLDVLRVIEQEPEQLAAVGGIPRAKAEAISEAWASQQRIADVMVFLQTHGATPTLAVKIYKAYGDAAVAIVSENPYRLADEIWGVGFKTADGLARSLGLAQDAPARLRAGLKYALGEAGERGHVYLPPAELVRHAARLLEVAETGLHPALEGLLADGELVADGPGVYLPPMLEAERAVAEHLQRLLRRPAEVPPDLEERLDAVVAEQALSLAPEQREAVLQAMRQRVSILTGGPGTGKTTTVRALVALLRSYDYQPLLASPTGRAAKRLAEVTGAEARTLHRLLEFAPARSRFTRDADRPVEADLVLVDEASMLDLPLAKALLEAVPPLGHLVLVGDRDQLPSVGPGQVLGDLLASRRIPAVALTRVFRQGEGSLVVDNAHAIRAGHMPELVVPDGSRRTDCYFLEAETPEEAVKLVLNAVKTSLPRRFGLAPEDIQVLAPVTRGVAGTLSLNTALQEVLNPGPAVQRGLRAGDRVIQLRNDYDRQVFNGDMGTVIGLDAEAQQLRVRMLDAEVAYDLADLHELALAYAITVHKAQGSEFPAVVIPLVDAHGGMLQRNLLYTALTRARQVAVLVGSRSAIERAVRTAEDGRRFTHLAERLK